MEEILAGISRAYACRVQGYPAAATSGDLQFFQIWLQLTALHHQESHHAGFPGTSGRAAGRSIIHINILVSEVLSLGGIEDAVKTYTDLPYIIWCGQRVWLWAKESPLCCSLFSDPLLGPWHSRFFTCTLQSNTAAADFLFSWRGEYVFVPFIGFSPFNNNALKMFDICN